MSDIHEIATHFFGEEHFSVGMYRDRQITIYDYQSGSDGKRLVLAKTNSGIIALREANPATTEQREELENMIEEINSKKKGFRHV